MCERVIYVCERVTYVCVLNVNPQTVAWHIDRLAFLRKY